MTSAKSALAELEAEAKAEDKALNQLKRLINQVLVETSVVAQLADRIVALEKEVKDSKPKAVIIMDSVIDFLNALENGPVITDTESTQIGYINDNGMENFGTPPNKGTEINPNYHYMRHTVCGFWLRSVSSNNTQAVCPNCNS